jgi:hypothetical protein
MVAEERKNVEELVSLVHDEMESDKLCAQIAKESKTWSLKIHVENMITALKIRRRKERPFPTIRLAKSDL